MAFKQIRSGVKNVTTAGTRVQLSTTKVLAQDLVITAKAGNAGVVYLGDVTVAAANGYSMAAGVTVKLRDLLPEGDIVDLSRIYLDAATNGDGVTFLYFETYVG